jgi:hypothetical protein
MAGSFPLRPSKENRHAQRPTAQQPRKEEAQAAEEAGRTRRALEEMTP